MSAPRNPKRDRLLAANNRLTDEQKKQRFKFLKRFPSQRFYLGSWQNGKTTAQRKRVFAGLGFLRRGLNFKDLIDPSLPPL